MAKKIIEIVHKKPSELKLTFGNPRKITDKEKAKLKESIEKLGDFGVIVINASNQVISGNQRIQVMQEMDLDVPVACKQLKGYSIGEQKIINIRANKSSGDFQENELNEWLKEINDEFGSIDLTGFNSFKLDNEVEEDGYEIPEEIKTDIKVGDLFEIGPHRLLCGDSTKEENYDILIKDETIDMIFTDPPYGVDYNSQNKSMYYSKDKKGKSREKIIGDKTDDVYEKIMPVIKKICKGVIYIFCGAGKEYNCLKSIRENNLILISTLIWNKQKGSCALGANYKPTFEMFYYCQNGKDRKWIGNTNEWTVWDINTDRKNEHHPTQKPIEIPYKAIRNHNIDIVLDLFLGSGSTMMAAHQLNKKCYGLELDPKYCQVILDRMTKFDPSIKIKKNGVEYASR